MPTIGGVYIPDEAMPQVAVRAPPRPGLGDILGASAQRAYGQLRYGLPLELGTLRGDLTPEDKTFYQQGLATSSAAAQQAAPASAEDLWSGRVNPVRGITENIVASLPSMAGAIAGAVGGSFVAPGAGTIAGAVVGGVPQFVGSNVARAVEEQGELTEAAAARSALVAAPQAAADAVLGRFLPGVGKVLGPVASRQQGSLVRRVATSAFKAGATEAVTETGQQALERYAAGLALGDQDARSEYAAAATIAFGMGGMLGAGGGIRRTPATAKPSMDVSSEDLVSHIDQVLALPSPAMFVDAAGRAAEGSQGLADLAATPRESDVLDTAELPNSSLVTATPDVRALLEQGVGPAPEIPMGSRPSTSALMSMPAPGETVMPDVTAGARPFASEPAENLQKVVDNADRIEATHPGLPAMAQQELATREREAFPGEQLELGLPDTRRLSEVRRGTQLDMTNAYIDDINRPKTWEAQQAELKKGLRGGFVQGVTGTDIDDLRAKVTAYLDENPDARTNVLRFAQRLSVLDDSFGRTALAKKPEAPRSIVSGGGSEGINDVTGMTLPAPPQVNQNALPLSGATTGVEDSFKSTLSRLPPAVRALGPTSETDLRRKLVTELGRDTSDNNDVLPQVEKAAQAAGILNEAKEITPLGRQAYLETSQGVEHTAQAAVAQGFQGAQASQFDRGARAYLDAADPPRFDGFEEMAAWQAGRTWAERFIAEPGVATRDQTESFTARNLANRDRRNEYVVGVELSPAQIQQQALNRAIDSVDLSAVPDESVAQLRRMVRDGATAAEVGAALEQRLAGKPLFVQPPAAPVAPFRGEVVTRGAPRRQLARAADVTQSQTREAARAESAFARRKYLLRQELRAAFASGDLDTGTFARLSQRLSQAANKAHLDQVTRGLPGHDGMTLEAHSDARRGSAMMEEDPRFEAAVTGKTTAEVLDHMVASAPTPYHTELMSAVRAAAKRLADAGVPIDFQVVQPGDRVPRILNTPGTRGATHMSANPRAMKVWLNSAATGRVGTNYETAAHEFLHAVTMGLITEGNKVSNTNTATGRAVKDLYDLANGVIAHFNERVRSGEPLTAFEERLYSRYDNALRNPHEILAWGMTNRGMQEYLATIPYGPRQSFFGALIEKLRALLGLSPRVDNVLAELVRVSNDLLNIDTAELRSLLVRDNADGGEFVAAAVSEDGAASRTAEAQNETARTAVQQASDAADKLLSSEPVQRGRDTARRLGLSMASRNHIDELYGDIVPGLRTNTVAHQTRNAVRNKFQLMSENIVQALDKLKQSERKQDAGDYERIQRLMRSAQFGVDGARTWEQHQHLANEPNQEGLKAIHAAARADYQNLVRHNTVGVFEEARVANEAANIASMIGQIYDLISNDPEYRAGVVGGTMPPGAKLLATEGLGTARQMRDFLDTDLTARVNAAKAYLVEMNKIVAIGSAKEKAAADTRLNALQSLIDEIAQNRATMERQPYFHLPRFGDHFVSFTVRKDGKVVDQKALAEVAKRIEAAGFKDVQLSTDNSNPQVMMRTENKSQAADLKALAQKLKEEGWLDSETEVLGGPRTSVDNFGLGGRIPDYLAAALRGLESDPIFQPDESLSSREKAALEAQKDAAMQALVDTWLDMQPDSSLSRVLAKRENVQGASTDMVRGFAHRQNVGAIGVANLWTRPQFGEALKQMGEAVEQAKRADTETDPYVVNDVVTEIRRREAQTPVDETADSLDKLRALAHTAYLGLNVSSAAINMTALGTTVLPELAKRNGFVNAFHAMRRAAPQAFAIINTARQDAWARGLEHAADLSLTEDVLNAADVPNDVRSFVRQRVAEGDIDLATAARALGQLARGQGDTGLDVFLRYGSAFNLYSEAFARLTAAIAARDLHGSGNSVEAHSYAQRVVKESLFEFQPGRTGRAFGKQGVLGPVTPLVTQFMQWNLQVTEKLYREFKAALGGDREAMRFLGGHIAAITTIAGTLGLPFATVFAAVAEKLFGDDDEPLDATASWRNFLASVFGEDMGEILARGAPRALGFDISTRAGEANLLPFSEFLADRRSWREAFEEFLGSRAGAAPNMVVDWFGGASQIMDGDVLGGMKTALPVFLKNPVEVYRMSTEGYVDTRGNKLPLTPKASDYLWQLLGFTPAQKAEYSEARGDQTARRGELTRRATMLGRGITKALLQGDTEGARDLVAEAQAFDARNPAFAVLPTIQSRIQAQARARAQARAIGAPVGVSVKDVAGQGMTGYANVNYAM